MPCSDPGADAEYNRDQKRRLDQVTRLLCSLCKQLVDRGDQELMLQTEGGELLAWWIDHVRQDVEREHRERLESMRNLTKTEALSKLTAAEVEALGIRPT